MVCVHIDMGEHVEWYEQPNATLRGCLSSWRKGWGIFWLFNTEMLLQVFVTAGFGTRFFLILAVSTGSCVHFHGAKAKKDRNSLASTPWHHCPPSNSFIFLKDCPLQRNFGNALNKVKCFFPAEPTQVFNLIYKNEVTEYSFYRTCFSTHSVFMKHSLGLVFQETHFGKCLSNWPFCIQSYL